MRIIAGTHRSRNILAPRGDQVTRPITDRVKQSLFDRLASRGLLGEGFVLDVFSGTGSLGLEALSRGAAHCTFLEQSRQAVLLLQRNLEALALTGQAKVMAVDALSAAWLRQLPHRPLRLIFCDPPYRLMHDTKQAARLMSLIHELAQLTEPFGACVLRTDDRTAVETVEGWLPPDSHQLGSMTLHLFERPG